MDLGDPKNCQFAVTDYLQGSKATRIDRQTTDMTSDMMLQSRMHSCNCLSL